MSNEITVVSQKQAKDIVNQLTMAGKWQQMVAKDVPQEILSYVTSRIKDGKHIDLIRQSLGMTPTDIRWRKIMTALRAAKRIDATGLFLKWLERNESIGDTLNRELEAVLKNEKPFSKMILQSITALSTLQLNTVKLGKELGVFVDPQEKGQGNGQVTIVVNTNVPSPDEKTIVVHQENQLKKNLELLEQHRK